MVNTIAVITSLAVSFGARIKINPDLVMPVESLGAAPAGLGLFTQCYPGLTPGANTNAILRLKYASDQTGLRRRYFEYTK